MVGLHPSHSRLRFPSECETNTRTTQSVHRSTPVAADEHEQREDDAALHRYALAMAWKDCLGARLPSGMSLHTP